MINNTEHIFENELKWFEEINIIVNNCISNKELLFNKNYNTQKESKKYISVSEIDDNLEKVKEYNMGRMNRKIINNFKFGYQYDIYESIQLILMDSNNVINYIVCICKGNVAHA